MQNSSKTIFFLTPCYSLKAYAELEKDTPGQIFGVTFKSDGKSNTTTSEPISEKFTQRPDNEDTYYEEHDVTDTHEYKKNQLGPRFYFVFGMLIVFLAFLFTTSSKTESFIEYERDRTLAEQRQREENRKKGPFDEA